MSKTETNGMSILFSLFLLIIAAVIITKTTRDITFYYDKEVVSVITKEDVSKISDNKNVSIELELDINKSYSVSYLSQREFLLIPFKGIGYDLMYVIEGPITDKLFEMLQPPYKGRAVGKDFADSWDVYGKSMKLRKIFRRDGLKLSDQALLVYDSPKGLPNLWQFFLFALAIFYVIYKGLSFGKLIGSSKPEQKSEHA